MEKSEFQNRLSRGEEAIEDEVDTEEVDDERRGSGDDERTGAGDVDRYEDDQEDKLADEE